MSAHELLLKKIDEATKLASDLSTHERDSYAKAVEALMVARVQIKSIDLDRSSECQCPCHTKGAMHFMPCSCYSGRPVLRGESADSND